MLLGTLQEKLYECLQAVSSTVIFTELGSYSTCTVHLEQFKKLTSLHVDAYLLHIEDQLCVWVEK